MSAMELLHLTLISSFPASDRLYLYTSFSALHSNVSRMDEMHASHCNVEPIFSSITMIKNKMVTWYYRN